MYFVLSPRTCTSTLCIKNILMNLWFKCQNPKSENPEWSPLNDVSGPVVKGTGWLFASGTNRVAKIQKTASKLLVFVALRITLFLSQRINKVTNLLCSLLSSWCENSVSTISFSISQFKTTTYFFLLLGTEVKWINSQFYFRWLLVISV